MAIDAVRPFSYSSPTMNRLHRTFLIITTIAASFGTTTTFAVELPRHQPQVVVLRNGSLLQGVVQRESQRVIVADGKDRITKVALNDVDFICKDLSEAYRRKLSRLQPDDVSQHLRLAQWCLRYDYPEGAADRLLYLHRIAPRNTAVRALEKRMRRQANETVATKTEPAKRNNRVAEAKTLPVNLPSDALPHFTRVVQPLLINRCGQTTCHGQAGQTEFRLVRGIRGSPNRDLTWKNLASTLAHIDRSSFAQSPLLLKARSVHGHTNRAPIETHENRQFTHLYGWVESIVAADRPAKSRAPEAPQDGNGDIFDVARSSMHQSATRTPHEDALSQLYGTPTNEGSDSEKERKSDPFDPAEFNTRHATPVADAPSPLESRDEESQDDAGQQDAGPQDDQEKAVESESP